SFKKMRDEMHSISKIAGKDLENHMIRDLASSQKEFNSLSAWSEKSLKEGKEIKSIADVISRQREYLAKPLETNNWSPSANIGTKAEVSAGEKVFENKTTLARACRSYEKALLIKGDSEAADAIRNRMHKTLDKQWSNLGSRANYNEEDIERLSKRKEFLAKVSEKPNLASTEIGTQREWAFDQKLFRQGSADAKTLSNYAESMAQQSQLLSRFEQANSNLALSEGMLSAQIEKGAGSLAQRVLCASGRGLLIAGSAIALSYAFEQIANAVKQK
ncbi:MAG: hypothetical protein K2X81_12395, partial [Candidatus Obscuribacterales bacterium]|nr:hypothetical protein [Candidatus Obscuribacterales bacterium]